MNLINQHVLQPTQVVVHTATIKMAFMTTMELITLASMVIYLARTAIMVMVTLLVLLMVMDTVVILVSVIQVLLFPTDQLVTALRFHTLVQLLPLLRYPFKLHPLDPVLDCTTKSNHT